jgi:hypothetical protein
MTEDERLAAFSTTYLGGRSVPPDLVILLKMQWDRVPDPGGENYVDPLEAVHFRFLSDGRQSIVFDKSYLSEEDRANPDIMANVAAIDDVLGHILVVGEYDDYGAYGYWLGPESRPIESAPIVRLDTEGQFELRRGRTLAEALLLDYGSYDNDEEFIDLRDWFNDFGVNITASSRDEFPSLDIKPSPDDLHLERYNVHRVAAGLPPYVPHGVGSSATK